MSCIFTYTGKPFDPVQPDPANIDIRDIAHALSLTCRGNGHVKTFYSVAQHRCSCAREAIARGFGARVALLCLLHDASEAYMSDVPRPFKAYLDAYKQLEEQLLSVIYARYLPNGPTAAELAMVKQIDDDMLAYDLALLFSKNLYEAALPVVYAVHDRSARPFDSVESEYLSLFDELSLQV